MRGLSLISAARVITAIGMLALPLGPAAAQDRPAGDDPVPVSAASATAITLDEAIRQAIARDPEHAAAAAAVSSARADLLEARGSWLPTLTLSSAYANSGDERVDQATGRLVSESYTAQAAAGLLLFAGGRRIFAQQAAAADLAGFEAEHRARRFQTILNTTEIFYETAAAADLERLSRQRLERARKQLDFARARLDLGTATTSDVLRAELEVGNAELAVLDAGLDLRTAALSLGRQIGVAEEVHPVAGVLPERAPDLPALNVLVDRALAGAPDVIAAEAARRARDRDRLRRYTTYLPSLYLSGGYDWTAFDWPPDRRSWSLRLTASLPILDGFARKAAVQRAAASLRLAEARMRDAAIAARVEVEDAVGRIESAEIRVGIADRAVRLADEDLRVLEERYQLGAATILDLQASQVALTDAEAAAVRARQDLGAAVARLEAILGETIDMGDRD